jgi:hypothetical protein
VKLDGIDKLGVATVRVISAYMCVCIEGCNSQVYVFAKLNRLL